jgi:hypothetical protein
MDDRQLDARRREARTLLRSVRTGNLDARARATSVLGARVDERFVLADALHVVAWEQGALSWPALVARTRAGVVRTALDGEPTHDDGRAEVEVETDLRYPDGSPVVIYVRRRQTRFLLTDRGEALSRSGRPSGWAETAERAVRRTGMNVSPTTGAVFVPAAGVRDLDDLALRLARASVEVLEALLELGEQG